MSSQYKLKRCLAGILATVIAVSAFSGCSGNSDSRRDDTEEYETEDRDNERDEDKESDSFSGGIFGNNDTPSHVELGSGAGEYLPVDTPPEEVIDEYVYPDIWEVLPYIDETSVSKFKYEYDADLGGMAITDYTGASPKVRIPDKIEGEPVVSANLGDAEITHLVMPTTLVGLKCVPDYVEYANYPNSELLYFSGKYDRNPSYYETDYGCAFTKLKAVYIEPSVELIGSEAFSGCTNLTSIIIPDSVTVIDIMAFAECANLIDVTIPESVYWIETGAFTNCTNLTNVNIPDSVTKIGEKAFNNCSSLTSIAIPPSRGGGLVIGEYAFSGCKNLTSIDIPDSVGWIDTGVFYCCTSLTAVTIPDSVGLIGESAFSGCTSLTSIIIPDSVVKIGRYAFSNCTSLTSVAIPDSVTEIGEYAFSDCENLTNITYKNKIYSYESTLLPQDDALYCAINCPEGYRIKDGVLTYCVKNYSGELVIPDGVTSIGRNAFSYCTRLTSIVIPDSVTEIDEYEFSGCTSLTSVTYKDKTYYYDTIDELYDAINNG